MSAAAEDPWLTTKEVAARLRVEPETLWKWRRAGYGPLSVPFGRRRRYRESDVADFEQQQTAAAVAEQRERRAS